MKAPLPVVGMIGYIRGTCRSVNSIVDLKQLNPKTPLTEPWNHYILQQTFIPPLLSIYKSQVQ